MNTIQQQLADRLYELLPHKKELEFGCEWKLNNDIWTYANGFSFIKNNKNSWSGVLPEKDVIIGQPLHLADLLLAIDKHTDETNNYIYTVWTTGLFADKVKYNLSQDNILNQSDELCKWALEILK